jgi:mono/diheme cytochrome c family protein
MSGFFQRALLLVFVLCIVAFGLGSLNAIVGDEPIGLPQKTNPSSPETATFAATLKPFLKTYCVGCHGAKLQKGDRRFDTLAVEIFNDNALVDYQDILDQLNLSEMPPHKAKQPSDDERREVVRRLTNRIKRYHQEHKASGGQTVLRRLNAREYRNTIRDLLDLNMTIFDPTSPFPKDQTTEQLDNIGDTLVTSGFLLARHLEAAELAIDKALLPLEKPPVQTWVFRDGFRQQPEIDQVHRRTNTFKHMTLYDVVGADKHEGAYGPILAFKKGVPFDGIYEIRLKAEAVNRLHPYDPKFLGTDPSEPLRLGIVSGDYLAGQLHKPQPVEPLLAEMDLADESKWYTVRVWLDAGFTPRFTFRNGLMDARTLWSRLLRKYPEKFPKRTRPGIVEARYNAIAFGKLPQIHIHEIEIEGPFFDTWPTASQRAILGDDCEQILDSGSLTKEFTRELLITLLSKAYRRPARVEDVDRIMQVVDTRQQAGRSPLEAYTDGLKAVLCSPNFLYMEEPTRTTKLERDRTEPRLSATALASRLSYFLWSSMPDQTLRELAASKTLQQPKVLAAQVNRMLQDEKSDAFIDGFLGSWLNLRDLDSTPPDRNKFRAFYHYDLGTAMRRETHLFMRHLIDKNLGLVHFLDSSFTFVNKPLATLYGMTPPKGHEFQQIKLKDRRRGGLLGQASILTVTANGIDTSPVVRGVWILENILGTPPSSPPPDVEPLEPDIRGAKTIRDQLEKHRNVASCYDCHRKIDPLGFALENFDPIGKWRDSYSRQAKIDASGVMPNGEAFGDIEGLKRILVKNKDQFARALTEKLLAYATGRQLTPAARPHIDQILTQLRKHKYRFRDLIHLIVISEPFRLK